MFWKGFEKAAGFSKDTITKAVANRIKKTSPRQSLTSAVAEAKAHITRSIQDTMEKVPMTKHFAVASPEKKKIITAIKHRAIVSDIQGMYPKD